MLSAKTNLILIKLDQYPSISKECLKHILKQGLSIRTRQQLIKLEILDFIGGMVPFIIEFNSAEGVINWKEIYKYISSLNWIDDETNYVED